MENALVTIDATLLPKISHLDVYISNEYKIKPPSSGGKIMTNTIQNRTIELPPEYEYFVYIKGKNRHFDVTVWVSDTNESYWNWSELEVKGIQ